MTELAIGLGVLLIGFVVLKLFVKTVKFMIYGLILLSIITAATAAWWVYLR